MTTDTTLFTLETMPADDRLELVDGRIVPKMSPVKLHARIQLRLGAALLSFVDERQIGAVFTECNVVIKRNPDTVRLPDLIVVSYARDPEPNDPTSCSVPPELAVEVISQSNTWKELDRKIREYFAFGVDRVWIINPFDREVSVYRSPDSRTLFTDTDNVPGEGVLEGFSFPVQRLFQER